MSRHGTPDEAVEQAALYALGAMTDTDAARFEAHLREGCDVCEREVRSFAGTAEQLALAAAPRAPRADLRAQLLARAADPRPVVVRSADLTWEAGRVDGMVVARLFTEPAGRTTALVRLVAGADYPAHRHPDTEELYVIDGELTVDDDVLRPGDYCAGLPGTAHRHVHSGPGSTFLLVASDRDEVLPAGVTGLAASGLTVLRREETPWQPVEIPGVMSRRLLSDPTRQAESALVRMAPGSSLPRHLHVSPEQLYVLEGDARVGHHRLAAGDYYRLEGGTVHDVSDTVGGCVFLLISSRMEILAPRAT